MKNILALIFIFLFSGDVLSQRKYIKPEFVKNWSKPGRHPDHIVLNFSENPATTVSVTWRTSKEVKSAYGEIARAHANPAFIGRAEVYDATTENINYSNVVGIFDRDDPKKNTFNTINHNYHSITFRDLEPNTVYGYRVGDGKIWSEWIQFKTAHKAVSYTHLTLPTNREV